MSFTPKNRRILEQITHTRTDGYRPKTDGALLAEAFEKAGAKVIKFRNIKGIQSYVVTVGATSFNLSAGLCASIEPNIRDAATSLLIKYYLDKSEEEKGLSLNH